MTDEIEVPTEHLHEHIEHMAHHSGEKWLVFVALSSALLAVLAATSALLAGHHANEAIGRRHNVRRIAQAKTPAAVSEDQSQQPVRDHGVVVRQFALIAVVGL